MRNNYYSSAGDMASLDAHVLDMINSMFATQGIDR